MDIAAMPIVLPREAAAVCIQDFAPMDSRAIEPGLDVIVIGYPFEQTEFRTFPIWKRAMIASEPSYLFDAIPQMLIDTPSTPGMSGSPIFRSAPGFGTSKEVFDALTTWDGSGSALDLLRIVSPADMQDETVVLTFIGIYAGSTGTRAIDELSIGRCFMASLVSEVVRRKEAGQVPQLPFSVQNGRP